MLKHSRVSILSRAGLNLEREISRSAGGRREAGSLFVFVIVKDSFESFHC
jgi:hypothetical protein